MGSSRHFQEYAAMSRKINVAIVGLGFGAEFIPLWQKHPHTNCYAICQRNKEKLDAVGEYFGVGAALHGFRSAAHGPQRGCRSYQLPDSRPRLDEPRGAQGRQARGLHGADGHQHRRLPQDRGPRDNAPASST